MTQPYKLEVMYNQVAVPASTLSGTVFTAGQIPAGMRVKNVELYNSALGASVTLSAGVTGSPTLFVNAGAAASAGKLAMTDTLAGNVGNRDEVTARNVILTTGGATTAASAQTVDVYVTLVPDYR